MLVAHVGIIGHDRIMISCAAQHYTNQGIKESGKVSVSLVDDALLPKADYVGSVSGSKSDKSHVFDYEVGSGGAPVIKDSPLTMECSVVDTYLTPGFESFILKIENTYVDEKFLISDGKIDFAVFKPILFEFPTYEYLRTGEIVGKCLQIGTAASSQ
jgi:flavin reductase (DIM6/NTAB) family NADH-FMN oxidoreductase RutF